MNGKDHSPEITRQQPDDRAAVKEADERAFGDVELRYEAEHDETIRELLFLVPPQGGYVDRETLRNLVSCAFVTGVIYAERNFQAPADGGATTV